MEKENRKLRKMIQFPSFVLLLLQFDNEERNFTNNFVATTTTTKQKKKTKKQNIMKTTHRYSVYANKKTKISCLHNKIHNYILKSRHTLVGFLCHYH